MSDDAPRAEIRDFQVLSPWGPRADPYYWLRDDERDEPAVLAYLQAENDYRARQLAHVQPLEERLYQEMVGRLRQDDATVPVLSNGYWYSSRYEPGREYALHVRRLTPDAVEELLVDGNLEAAGHDFYELGNLEVSPDNRTLALAEDTRGRRQYTLRFRDLSSGCDYPERIENVEPDLAWADDGQSLLYVAKDPETLLGYRVFRHVLGTPPDADTLVYEEADRAYYMGVERSKSGHYVYIVLQSTVSSEYHYARTDDPALLFRIALPRERDHEYQLDDVGDRFVIRSNHCAPNFRIASTPIDAVADRTLWRDEVAHRAEVFVGGFEVFRDFLVIAERAEGLRKIRVRAWDGSRDFLLDAAEPAYTMSLGDNEEIASHVLRYVYSSLTTPRTTYDYDMRSGERVLLKRDPVEGHFDSAHYATEFVQAPTRDGKRVPVSLLYRRGCERNGTAPLYQYAYGSYGHSMDPSFRSSVLSLVDRGFVFALAHVRGGQELGRFWYDDGRMLAKRHTFEDFIDVTRHLVSERYVDPARVCAAGGSAGGLLVGAVANLAPGEYRAMVADVPFVDIVTTMLDDDIPLTTNEYDEWGNPAADRQVYEYMLSYSPYDNVSEQAYPAMLVTTALHDSQVQYWEPAKWVALLRARRTNDALLVLRTDFETGHGGKPGRFQRYRETAQEYAFVLDQTGLAASEPSHEESR
ncbi:MAG: S9 family peptidase [Proteobacteria bacterium]|nr:S9 family peptidase [Pseudomonadota bacterium]